MTISKDLFLAILSLDSYNRGYGSGIFGLGGENTQIGSAVLGKDAEQLLAQGTAQTAGFYAISYTVGAGVDGIAAGTTVISYRGTDAVKEYLGTDYPIHTGDYDSEISSSRRVQNAALSKSTFIY